MPFRSVATRILKGLDETSRKAFDLHVLRPPTFEKLAQTLRAASAAGRPYHVLHFDGHGAHLEMAKLFEQWEKAGDVVAQRLLQDALDPHPTRFSPREIYPRNPRPGKHGYLLFENPESELNQRFVDGQELAGLLEETGVPVLVLNACRSAYAEAREEPDASNEPQASDESANPHQTVRALGSLAQELMDSGVGGVVAMRYNVYVVTAARFVAEVYGSLARGRSLGAAVALGRKHLHDEPLREVVADPLALQDWQVPIVYEAAPIALFPKLDDGGKLEITLTDASTASAASLDPNLPPDPDAGFYGRDETLLALDRAFDDQPIVLLHAYAGSGKTATAAEFARWYAITGGVKGPVLFTSFEHHMPLPRVLDRFGEIFGQMLKRSGVHWLAITDEDERRQVALQVLQQVPVLWIWDNVEPVNGFPTGAESTWTTDEQAELADFLRACRNTKARFLLTSRREERPWLGGLPSRIRVPPMPMTERLQLARALAAKQGHRAEVMKDWRPLLEFSDGNSLTLTVLVGQALRDKLAGRAAVQGFVERLRAGEAALDDEVGEGRSRSLGASLEYGFEHAFNEEERRRLALLHLFQGFVDVGVILAMGHPEASWCLPEVRGLSPKVAVTLLDRAAEVGLLTCHGNGCYGIHPALPWFFRSLFDRFHSATQEATLRAFVNAMASMADYYHNQYEAGNRDVIDVLRAEEANLLQTRRLARSHSWWGPVASAMQGLQTLYAHTQRRAVGHKDCACAYEESLDLLESIRERAGAAACALSLGHVYKNIPALRDLRQAEHWYRRSLELTDEHDRMGRGKCLAQLGYVSFEQSKKAREQKRPEDEFLHHLNEAVSFYHRALEHFPEDAIDEFGVAHNMLGGIYGTAGDLDHAVAHLRDAIRYREKQGFIYEASVTRYNVALVLSDGGRPQDALDYARAALRGFESYGESAAGLIQQTCQLIEEIEREL